MKTKSLKRFGALVMAMVMCFALAVSASAVANGNYTVNLNVPGLPEGHNMDFFDTATVVNTAGKSVVTIPVQEAEVFGVTGNVIGAEVSDAQAYSDYTVSFDEDAEAIVITCPTSISASAFNVGVTFTVDTARGHIPATGYMTLEAA